MSTRLSETIASLHEIRSITLQVANIDDEGACTLANALKANKSVREIDLGGNGIGNEGASIFV
jgi:hypothetical protein